MHIIPSKANQAHQLAIYAKNFIKSGSPSAKVLQRTQLFHTDSIVCGISALNYNTNAPILFRSEALQQSSNKKKPGFAKVLGSKLWVPSTLSIVANCSAVRQWDSNGTVFGYSSQNKSRQAGQFGHNDFYPVVLAAANQNSNIKGDIALKAMTMLDQIRGRLCQVFSLKTYKIDHVVHGAIASIVTYGTLMQAKPQQIQSAIGMFVAHYIPFRAIRAGKQISDSKGASAAISTQAGIICMKRAMKGFVGPKNIFQNPQAIFRLFSKKQQCPFDITLGMTGQDFAIMGMHFKLGLYQHQSAGALQAVQKLIIKHKLGGFDLSNIKDIQIVAYQPAFGIIGGAQKKDPKTRQSADHSMAYIVATLIRKASQNKQLKQVTQLNQVWKKLMLMPQDYGYKALYNKQTRQIMSKINFSHGGPSYDSKYPQGIPTSVKITLKDGNILDSSMIMFPSGHSRNTQADLKGILNHKFNLLSKYIVQNQKTKLFSQLNNFTKLSNQQINQLFDIDLKIKRHSIDSEKFEQ